MWLTLDPLSATISVMSIKGFFTAILCLIAGGVGFYFSMMGIMTTTVDPTGWIILLIISIIALVFGAGVFFNRIKL